MDTTFAVALAHLWPNGDEKIKGLRAGMIAAAPAVFAKYGINSKLLLAHVMAQVSHECGAGHDVVENLSYTPERIVEVWPSRFANAGAAAPYAKNPRALANKVYNGRMGNRVGSDDGWNFRGRGGSQTTGREGYQKLATVTGLPLIDNPDLVNNPSNFLECAVADFVACGCMEPARSDNVVEVTKRLNGGLIGIDQRKEWLAKWKAADVAVPTASPIILPPAAPVSPKPPPAPKPPSAPPTAPAPSQGNWLANLIAALLSIFKRK